MRNNDMTHLKSAAIVMLTVLMFTSVQVDDHVQPGSDWKVTQEIYIIAVFEYNFKFCSI